MPAYFPEGTRIELTGEAKAAADRIRAAFLQARVGQFMPTTGGRDPLTLRFTARALPPEGDDG